MDFRTSRLTGLKLISQRPAGGSRVGYASIDVRFRGYVENGLDVFRLLLHQVKVVDVASHEAIAVAVGMSARLAGFEP